MADETRMRDAVGRMTTMTPTALQEVAGVTVEVNAQVKTILKIKPEEARIAKKTAINRAVAVARIRVDLERSPVTTAMSLVT